MIHKSGIFAVVTALLIVTIFSGAAYADQNEALIEAIRKGDLKQVQELLNKGADVNAKDDVLGQTALMKAAEADRLEAIKLLLDRGADVNAMTNYTGMTALMYAADRGNVEIAKFLLDRGSDVNAKQFGTALMTACEKGHLPTASLLLDRGADINAKNEFGRTALMKAAEAGRLEVVKLLLDEGADVNAEANFVGMTALMEAADRGNLEITKLLLDRGADVNARLAFGTALTKACERGHLSTASLLLDRGAEVNATDHLGQTALMKAAEANHLHIVRFLLEKGADINAKDESGETALKMAVGKGHTAIAELLLNKGADVNSTDKGGVTALMTAAESGHLKTAQLLLDRGAQLNARDEKGRTALEHAARKNHRRVVDLLISRGVKTNLAVAAMVGDTAEVQRFLKEGADVNAKDDEGKTALILAVGRGHLEVVKLLLENHADVNVKTSGETALDIAQRNSFNEIYTVLRSNGAKTREGLSILKYADKILRRGNELFFRLANEKIVSRKDSPEQKEADFYSDPLGHANVRYRFPIVIEPWYVIDETYMECTGGQLLHRGSGQSTTVAGSLYFSPDKARFLALGCPDESCDVEIWKMTNSGPVKEYDLGHGCQNDFHWADPSTVEVLSSYGASKDTVIGRYTLDAATGKWSCSEQDSEETGTGKMCRDATDNLDYALANAAEQGDVEAVKTLLGKGANVNAKGPSKRTSLVEAAWKGHLEIVKLLLAKGAGTSESEKAQALAWAACHKDVVELLISHGAELTLPVAAAIGDLKAIKRLIKGGADVNAQDKDHNSAFSSAVHCNQWDAAILLLKNGAEIEDAYGLYNALLTTAAKDGHSGMIRTLLKEEPVAKEKLLPALDMAASEGKLQIVQLLLAEGADANGKDKHGRTALMAAAIKGQEAVAEFLLVKGADANARDSDGATALMDAAWGGNPQVVRLLLQKGSEVNAKDADGRTAVQYAKLSRNEEIVELLKAHGAKE